MQARRLDAQLPPVAWFRQRDVPYMKLEIEIGIFDPIRMIEAQRHTRNALPKRARLVQTLIMPEGQSGSLSFFSGQDSV